MKEIDLHIKIGFAQMDELQTDDRELVEKAIAATNNSYAPYSKNGLLEVPVSPCGACRQVILEIEDRYKQPIRILLYGTKGVYMVDSVKDLLPLCFVEACMR